MKLLMITRKIDKSDGLAGFTHNWVKHLARHLDFLYVICLEMGDTSGLPGNVKVFSLGKENGKNRVKEFFNFQKLAIKLVPKVDGVFSHQNPEYGILISPWCKIFRKKLIAWYAHGSVSFRLRILNFLAYKMVTSTVFGFRFPSKKLVILHQGIDHELFSFRLKEKHEEIRLLSISRISRTKNIDLMIELVKSLKSIQNKKIILKIVGEANSEAEKIYLIDLKKKINFLGLNENIEFLGSISNHKTPLFYQWADVFLNFSDTQSLDKTILEAMSCGTLVLTSNKSAKDILKRINNNFCVEDFTSSAQNLLRIIDCDYVIYAKKLRDIVINFHSLDSLTKKIKDLYVEKVKVVYLINSFLMGGAQKLLIDLAKLIDKDKFDVVVCSLKPNFISHGKYFNVDQLALEYNFKVFEIPKTKNIWVLFFRLYIFFIKQKPNIIHCHLPWSSIFGTFTGYLSGVRNIIIHEHNSPEFYSKKINFFLKLARLLSRLSICYSPVVEKEIFNSVNIFDDTIKIKNKKSCTIVNAVDIKIVDKIISRVNIFEKKESLSIFEKDTVVLSVGRLLAWKGHYNLIEAVSIANQLNKNIKLLIIGDGEEKGNLEKLIREKSLHNVVKLLGPRDDVIEVMAISDIFSSVLSYPDTFFSESVGISTLEAMACSLPVIIGQYPDVDIKLINYENVFIIPPNKPEILAKCILDMSNNEDLMSKIAKQSRRLIEENYSLSAVVKIYEKLYFSLL